MAVPYVKKYPSKMPATLTLSLPPEIHTRIREIHTEYQVPFRWIGEQAITEWLKENDHLYPRKKTGTEPLETGTAVLTQLYEIS